jgi:hypothetical protein
MGCATLYLFLKQANRSLRRAQPSRISNVDSLVQRTRRTHAVQALALRKRLTLQGRLRGVLLSIFLN